MSEEKIKYELLHLQRTLWKKVTKSNLPKENHPVFVTVEIPGLTLTSTDYILDGQWHRWSEGGTGKGKITHFMEFPLPPFSEDEKELEAEIRRRYKQIIRESQEK